MPRSIIIRKGLGNEEKRKSVALAAYAYACDKKKRKRVAHATIELRDEFSNMAIRTRFHLYYVTNYTFES